jgi:hypothetical protein
VAIADSLFGVGRERAEHELTLRRTALAIGWAALVGTVLVVGTIAVTSRSLGGVGLVLVLLVMWLVVGAVVAGVPLLVAALWVLRRLPKGRWPRVVVGALAGLAFGLVAELLAAGMSPVALFRQELGFATMLLLSPLVAGAVAGAIVGPRPEAVVEGPGPDERAEDALLDGAD